MKLLSAVRLDRGFVRASHLRALAASGGGAAELVDLLGFLPELAIQYARPDQP